MRELFEALMQWSLIVAVYSFVMTASFWTIYILAKPITQWFVERRIRREARDLYSYTVWIKGACLTTSSITAVRKIINKKVTDRASDLDLKEIISITHSPHAKGHQFTVWYKKKKYPRQWPWYDNFFYGIPYNFNR